MQGKAHTLFYFGVVFIIIYIPHFCNRKKQPPARAGDEQEAGSARKAEGAGAEFTGGGHGMRTFWGRRAA